MKYRWVLAFLITCQSSGGLSQTPHREADVLPPLIHSTKTRPYRVTNETENMHVSTYSTKVLVHHGIQLVTPPHNSTLTPGIVKFQWQVDAPKKKTRPGKLNLIVEKINSNKKHLIKTLKTESHVFCDAGLYRWRVINPEGHGDKNESRWRTFKVIELKYHSSTSSLSTIIEQPTQVGYEWLNRPRLPAMTPLLPLEGDDY